DTDKARRDRFVCTSRIGRGSVGGWRTRQTGCRPGRAERGNTAQRHDGDAGRGGV
ncbi:MAG: hypothetical protein AVDCRST_MAG93-4073, partial [uncultured Chloroflexia bacterium]